MNYLKTLIKLEQDLAFLEKHYKKTETQIKNKKEQINRFKETGKLG